MNKILILALALVVACRGADGAVGPEGPQGPQGLPGTSAPSAIVLTGSTGSAGEVSRAVVGQSIVAKPPTLTCYLGDGVDPVYLSITTGASGSVVCGLIYSGGVWNVQLENGPTFWQYVFVVIPTP